jgi:hypothetical protein
LLANAAIALQQGHVAMGQQRKFADLARHGPLSQSSLLKASVLGWPDERPQTKGNQAKES